MDEPSSSKDNKAMDAEMEAASAPPSRKRKHQETDQRMEDSSDEEDDQLLGEQELALRAGLEPLPRPSRYGKNYRLNCRHAQNSEDHTYVQHDDSSSSIVSVSSESEEEDLQLINVAPVAVNNPNNNPTIDFEAGPHFYKNEENFIYGHWLLFTSLAGGWNYYLVKVFIRRQLGLKCLTEMPIPRTKADASFRIFVKFETKEELDRVLEYFLAKRLSQYFMYSVVDQLPVGCFDSDSESDDDESAVESLQNFI